MPSSELSVVFCYVYVLRSLSNASYYVGFTHNLRGCITEHNAGLSPSTKPYRPWEILYYEAHRSEEDARRREKYLKTSSGKQALRRMIRKQLLSSGNSSQQKGYN
ncbi:MAG: GIY-YIG nuclease family protein [Candidatus Saccharibacteria bacterium]|nr:GIY-YIG nuclease family protein [Candidatus Saccharibacteria bacterium]